MKKTRRSTSRCRCRCRVSTVDVASSVLNGSSRFFSPFLFFFSAVPVVCCCRCNNVNTASPSYREMKHTRLIEFRAIPRAKPSKFDLLFVDWSLPFRCCRLSLSCRLIAPLLQSPDVHFIFRSVVAHLLQHFSSLLDRLPACRELTGNTRLRVESS